VTIPRLTLLSDGPTDQALLPILRWLLPALKSVESVPDPKDVLHEALRVASNLSGRRRKQIHPDIRRIADLIDDFAPLCAVPSFRAFEESLRDALRALGLLRDAR
jgi:hypothetical protein